MDNVRTPDLRDTNNLELLGGPFETASHTVEIRSPKTARGKYNIPNIGIFLWRLQSYPVDRTSAREVPGMGYTFDPAGKEIPLFNQPQTEEKITHLAEEINVPAPLRRLPLYNELEARRKALISSKTPNIYFGKQPVLSLSLIHEGQSRPDVILPDDIRICDLTNWGNPPVSPDHIRAAVDPVLGKLVLSDSISPKPLEVLVSYSYGFSHDVGAGPYTRTDFTHRVLNRRVDWQVGVSKEKTAVGIENIYHDLASAVEEWNKQSRETVGVIAIMDSRTYQDELTGNQHSIKIPDGSQLMIVAADWPVIEETGTFVFKRNIGQFAATGLRPHLLGDIHINGTSGVDDPNPGELVLDGILIEGKISVIEGNLGGLQVGHCTLVPENDGIEVLSSGDSGKSNDTLKLNIRRSVEGSCYLKTSQAWI